MRTKERVISYGEVFTPPHIVEAMLDLVRDEAARVESRFLEPACGNGNFLVAILRRKFATVAALYPEPTDRLDQTLIAIMSCYGIDLLADNVRECRQNMLAVTREFLGAKATRDALLAIQYVLTRNIVCGDTLKMLTRDNTPIVFPEWVYISNRVFQRQDFQLVDLLQSRKQAQTILDLVPPAPIKTYPLLSIQDLASQFRYSENACDLM